MIKNLELHISPISAFEHDISEEFSYVLISDDDRYDNLAQRDNILVVKFADTEDSERFNSINEFDVKAIIGFLESSGSKKIYIGCSAGVSRSSATVAGILKCTGRDDSYIWKSDEYRPNVLVYKTILQYFYPYSASAIELNNIASRSPEEYRYFRKRGRDMEFDKIIHHEVDGLQVDYGFFCGVKKNVVLFVKVGRDGSIYGYRNKYLKMASKISEKYGITVIVSSNPFCEYKWRDHMADAVRLIEVYFTDNKIDIARRRRIYFGHSDGASMAALYGKEFDIFDAYLLSNLPLPVIKDEEHAAESCNEAIKILLNMSAVSRTQHLMLVYGERDKGYETYNRVMTKLLIAYGQNYELHVVKNEAHNISEPVVEVLPELFFDENALIDKGLELDFDEPFL